MSNATNDVISYMDSNSLIVIASKNSAKLIAKLRGATDSEVGQMFGAAICALERDAEGMRSHLLRTAGPKAVEEFNAGMTAMRTVVPEEEKQMIRDVKRG